MQRLPNEPSFDYYLQVVKREEVPKWPKPAKELLVGSQVLDGGYVQYWAYPSTSGKFSDELPGAEMVASQNPAHKPVVIIDQNDLIELILAKDSHAWAKTETNLENLEDNLNSLVEFASEEFNMKVEHFVTTAKVSGEVENKLDEIENQSVDSSPAEGEAPASRGERQGRRSSVAKQEEPQTTDHSPQTDLEALSQEEEPIRKGGLPKDVGEHYAPAKNNMDNLSEPKVDQGNSSGSSKMGLVPIVVLLVVLVGAFFFRDKLLSKADKFKSIISGATPTPTLTPSPTSGPTATPTPAIDRSKYKIRVLNGTLQSGAASVLADKLKTLGWQVIKVGNANNNDTANTQVNIKKGQEIVGGTLAADIGSTFSASVSATLSASDKADAEVIIGKK